jgi:hypothetical protein
MSVTRISKKQLEHLQQTIGQRDKDVLRSLRKCRYMTTGQLQRLHFIDALSQRAALRAANRALAKLRDCGLITALPRRIGGARAGSGAYVWTLAEAGAKLLDMESYSSHPRKRFFDPSPVFLEHTLAVAETYLQLTDVCNRCGLELLKAEPEPDCWRVYKDERGKPTALKPDLFAVTATKDFEDHWFIEVDLATEAPSKVLAKCQRYAQYYRSGAEQKHSGVFPLVVWIVPSTSREASLQRYLADCKELKPKNIFTVLTPDELAGLIQKGCGI